MKAENEYNFEPNDAELGFAIGIQQRLEPSPQIEFIAQPALGGWGFVNEFFRFTNPATGQHEDCGVGLSMRYPSILVGSLAAIGLKYIPPAPARKAVTLAPNTAMPKAKAGQTDTPFGPSVIPSS